MDVKQPEAVLALPPRLRKPSAILEAFMPDTPAGTLRQWIFYADHSGKPEWEGLRLAVVRIGGSVYLDEDRFVRWLNDQRGRFVQSDRGRQRARKGARSARRVRVQP